VTDPAELEPHDELVKSATHERAQQMARRRRLRAWLISVGTSASVILLAVAGMSLLLHKQAEPSRRDGPRVSASDIVAIPHRDRLRVAGEQQLAAIALPAGWVRGAVVTDLDQGQKVKWTTSWAAPNGGPGGAAAIAPALAAAGWQACHGDSPDTCWQRFPYIMIVSCAGTAGRSCPALTVVMVDVLS
jgi:hypothetical protein